MTNRTTNGNANTFWRWLIAAALAAVSVATWSQPVTTQSVTASNAGFGAWYFGGGSASIGSSGTGLATLPNTPTNPTNASGWTRAGNYGVTPGATGLTFNSDVSFNGPGGVKVPVSVSAAATAASVGKAVAKTVFALSQLSTVWTIGNALYDLVGELALQQRNGANGHEIYSSTTKKYCYGADSNGNPNSCAAGFAQYNTQQEFCLADLANVRSQFPQYVWTEDFVPGPTTTVLGGPRSAPWGYCARRNNSPSGFAIADNLLARVSAPGEHVLTEQELADEIAAKSGWPSSSNLAKAAKTAMEAGNGVETGKATVSGPASVQGPKETTKNADGTSTEKDTKVNCTYATDTLTCKLVTTTTQKDAAGTPTGTPTTETKEGTPMPDDACKTRPDALGCMKVGEPGEGEIPKKTVNITYTEEALGLGDGSCPANPTWTDKLGSHSLNMQPICAAFTNWVKPVVLAFAALGALFIVTGWKPES
jgi:hypothetical protein